MNRLAFLILLPAITLPLCTGCVSSPPGATTPVAEIIPERVFAAGDISQQTDYHEFELARGGHAWLFLRNPADVDYEISLNGRRLHVCESRPKRVSLRAGQNRLGVQIDGGDSAYLTIRLVAVADTVDVKPVLDASRSPAAPVSASVQLTALGLPVPNTEVAVHLLGPRGRLNTRLLPVETAPDKPLLSGDFFIGKPPQSLSGMLARRVAVTDSAGKATITMPGLTLGEARLQAGIGELRLQSATRVIVPEIDLQTRVTSLLMPVNSRRFLPLELGLYGNNDRDRTVDVSYEVNPQHPGGLTIDGPSRIRFDRPKMFPLNPAVVAARTGEYSLTITAKDALSGKEDSLLIPVTVVARDDRLTPILYTPIAQPSGLALGSGETRIRFVAQVSGSAYKPDSLSLEEVDANGKLLRESLAILLDNGQGQDKFPNDFVYSGSATIRGAREGERYFRVKTRDRGVALLSESRPFLVTRFPLELPKPDVKRLVKFAADGTRVFRNQVILFLDSEMSNDGRRVERLAESVNGTIVGVTPAIRQYVLEFEGSNDAAAVRDVLESVRQQAGVVAAYPNFEVRELASPSEADTSVILNCVDDTDTTNCQWYIEHVDAHLAWEQAGGGSGESIAVFEASGVTGAHPELNGKCIDGNGTTPCAAGGHGTRVAGVLAAAGNNGGIAGVAWESDIVVYRDIYSTAAFYNALFANTSPAPVPEKVLNVSQEIPGATQTVMQTALDEGKLLVAAAGNVGQQNSVCNSDIPKYPAKFNEVSAMANRILSVGATDKDDALAVWGLCSNRAAWVDIYAPGKNIYTTDHPTGYTRDSGTSLATPIVAGAAAVLWSLEPGWSPECVHDRILSRSTDLSASPLTGEKLVNVYDMLGVPVLSFSDEAPTIKSDCSDTDAFTTALSSDPDLGDPVDSCSDTEELSFAFVDDTGSAVLVSEPFEINQITGDISVLPAECPLNAAQSRYDLTVRVTDSIGMTDESPLTVNVQDAPSIPRPPIDFEVTAMASSEDRRSIDPYTTDSGDVSFVVNDDFGFPDAVVGLVRNRATSACFEPSSANQTLGTGRDVSGTTDYIGLSGFQIRAEFAPALQPDLGEQVQIRAHFQALTGTVIRIRLFDASDNDVGSAQSVLSSMEGTCDLPGGQRAHDVIVATAPSIVAYAVFDVPTNTPSGGRVFVIDDVNISVN